MGITAKQFKDIQDRLGGARRVATPEQFAYDADGNLTSDGRWTYVWDAENRLVQMLPTTVVTVPDGAKRKLDFVYDYKGRRIQKAVSTWNGTDWSLTVSNRFLYDAWNLVAELNATNNAVIRTYLWGLDLSGSLQGAGGVGGLLAISDASKGRHFVSYDGNGNVMQTVASAYGNLSAVYEYGPFGEVIRATGPMAKANPFRFSTKYQDDESDLLYYGYRYYNQSTGRWLSRDPIEEKGLRTLSGTRRIQNPQVGLNGMAMVLNDPISGYDWLGLDAPKDDGYHSYCCPELAYWTPCSEVCRMAMRDPNVATKIKGGGVVCYHGKACGCLAWEPNLGYSPGECPEIDSIIQYHEDQHAPKADCSKCGFYRSDKWKPGVDDDTEECEQRKESIKRLEGVKDQLSEKCAAVAGKLLQKLKEDTANCP